MKTLPKHKFTLSLFGVSYTLFSCASHAASLVVGQSVILGSEQHTSSPGVAPPYHISVNANNTGIGSLVARNMANNADVPPYTIDITQPIQGYRFVNAVSNDFNDVIASGVSITMTTTDGAFDSFNASAARIWVMSDPGPNLLSPATTHDFVAGIRDIDNVSGSIDISGLTSGTIYFFYGARNSTPTITASMVDIDGFEATLNLTNFHNGDAANLNERYMSSLTFVNDAGYDTIDYAFAGTAGRWDGIVVTGIAIPEPSTALLGSLGMLALFRRRR